ncbi:flagellar biosynthesis protein FlhF [Comamonas sp. Y6]|uniref:Flagellar biosynthesis protein FlhF n=1 Tax=Comamonas resistens TaxID=3046670 RepID=A0ABY8SSF8_9BURK|nr:flagellar biosynthesis protein FlhF [Comamonas resistens]MDL5038634.1 flagellar biosynthesis protein FlhF [Comamonas resistens]WHS65997.1 flagellar biosynthesis protein FlhF [Comamonas resistens]
MNIKRFYAPTAREALAKARMVFGDGTLILSNRQTPDGVEVMATAEETLQDMDSAAQAGSSLRQALDRRAADEGMSLRKERGLPLAPAAVKRDSAGAAMSTLEHVQAREMQAQEKLQAKQVKELAQHSVQDDVEQLSMSTLTFQDYVRERMLRRRHESSLESNEPLPTFAQRVQDRNNERPAMAAKAQPASVARHNPLKSEAIQLKESSPKASAAAAPQNFMQEMQAMKDLIEERFNTLTWLGQTRQNPIQSSLMHKLIRAGYSPALARALIEKLPETLSAGDAVRWLMQVLERNLRTDAAQPAIYEQGGVFALVGATGVGKTTTTAKLAALCAAKHGPASVGLITLDTYRIGGHDQLRTYARMLGMVAHQAHDKAALQDLLGLLQSKKMVLIDTTGVAPRDPRKDEIMDVLAIDGVQQLLAVNAAAQGDAQDDVMQAFKARGSHQAILTKVDEAVKIGPSVDTLIRHQIQLRGVTNGQRVPEDFERASAQLLVSASMRSASKSAFDPQSLDLDFFFTPSSGGIEAAHA